MKFTRSFSIRSILQLALFSVAVPAFAAEIHVAKTGADTAPGSAEKPLLTISAAAQMAMPGDTITVHAGIYRERVDPPRGGESDAKRIVYQAAPGEKVTITGSDVAKTWEKVSGDTWKLTLPNTYFGKFNPYAEKVHGDWFNGNGRVHRRGNVYRDGVWLGEAPNLDAVMKPAGKSGMWFATVDGVAEEGPAFLMNIASLKVASGTVVPAVNAAERNGPKNAPKAEGGECVGYIANGSWLRYDGVDFGTDAESIEISAASAAGTGGIIELRDGHFDGPLLGTCEIGVTGDWQKWQPFTAKIKKTSGVKQLFLVFKSHAAVKQEATKSEGNTVIYAQFPGANPNEAAVEFSVRPTVFTPEKTGINYITVRGFDLRNAATNWAAPTMGQTGLVTAYWNKGWIIEDNEISYSRCCGIALGKYSDQWDGKRGNTEGYYKTVDDAWKKDGWVKENIGSHIVRRNHIHHCGQTGIVGSLGCAFSKIIANDIHDCNRQGIWSGAEMAGIKFHGLIDGVIADNHIHHNGPIAGLWLDWMTQGTHITGNLFHDNAHHDFFSEVNHGPILVANNLFLSPGSYQANSEGSAIAHNLVTGGLRILHDARKTPYMKPHSTDQVALHDCPIGDDRWYNNVLARGANLGAYNGAKFPVAAAGNVYTKGAAPSKFDADALLKPDFDTAPRLVQKADGWYLTLNADPKWKDEAKRKLITTALLGKAVIPDMAFENADGAPLTVDTDYFGKKRDITNPFPGPFETPVNGEVKVWPKN